MALTPKQRRFVEEYPLDLNATQAAIRAGYSAKTADKIGTQLLGKTSIKAAIAAALAERSKRTEVTADRVVRELALVAFSDVGDLLDFSGDGLTLRPACQVPERARRAVSSVKVRRQVEGKGEDAREVELIEFKFWSKTDALDKLARHTGVYPAKGAADDEPEFQQEE